MNFATSIRFRTLDVVRLAFVFVVIVAHYGPWDLVAESRLGVSFFFLASGFLMQMRHEVPSLSGFGWGTYLKRRLGLIYPVYWIAMCLPMLAYCMRSGTEVKAGHLLLQAALLQSWYPSIDVFFGIMPAAWFLSSLVWCYVVFPVLSFTLHRWGLCRWGGALLLAMAALAVVTATACEPIQMWTYVLPPARMIDFAAGMFLCQLLREHGDAARLSRHSVALTVVAVVLSAVALLIHRQGWVGYFSNSLLHIPASVALVTACVAVDIRKGGVNWGAVMALLVAANMEIYIFQQPASELVKLLMLAIGKSDMLADKAFRLMLVLVVLIPLALAVNHLFTKRLQRWLRGEGEGRASKK